MWVRLTGYAVEDQPDAVATMHEKSPAEAGPTTAIRRFKERIRARDAHEPQLMHCAKLGLTTPEPTNSFGYMQTAHANTNASEHAAPASSLIVFANALVAKLVLVVVVLITPSTERDECLT